MKRSPLQLRWQLMLSYLPLLLTPILVMGIVTRSVAEQGVTVLVTAEAQKQALALVYSYEGYYALHQSWQGVEVLFNATQRMARPDKRAPTDPMFDNKPPPGPEEVLIADNNGKIVASQNPDAIGQTLSADALSHGASIVVGGHSVGKLIIGAALGVLDQQQRQLLDTLNSALALSGTLSAIITVVLGLWFSRQITARLGQLMRGVRQLASGQWITPLTVYSSDEFGELTHAFNRMAAEITREQQLRRQMVADVAHDLRTPLSVMALEVEGINAGLQTPAEATHSLQEEIDWLQHLVDDLHTLSLLDANQVALQCEPVALTAFLRSVFQHWQTLAAKEQRQMTLDIPAELPIVSIDPYRMRQVLGNLLNNALHHTTSDAHITLSATVINSAVGEREIVINVIDTGDGIAPAALPHLFDRFYRADRSRSRRHHGSGLGLSIAAQWVALHGGRLTVQSELGHGAAFSVHLPIVKV